ncbi:uncharacterized protein BJX67DRAFT_378345 [Aspergillus lucknowensis]|uniref:Uncharacterized protein n=1 Tax=Aspergillus lucknowensis TaxID=176173 RepID=A0ABR4M0M7_9EURO
MDEIPSTKLSLKHQSNSNQNLRAHHAAGLKGVLNEVFDRIYWTPTPRPKSDATCAAGFENGSSNGPEPYGCIEPRLREEYIEYCRENNDSGSGFEDTDSGYGSSSETETEVGIEIDFDSEKRTADIETLSDVDDGWYMESEDNDGEATLAAELALYKRISTVNGLAMDAAELPRWFGGILRALQLLPERGLRS